MSRVKTFSFGDIELSGYDFFRKLRNGLYLVFCDWPYKLVHIKVRATQAQLRSVGLRKEPSSFAEQESWERSRKWKSRL